MINQQIFQGQWNEIKGKIKEKWGDLTDDDLQSFEGNIDQLIGTIQRKTGQSRDDIESFLDRLSTSSESATSTAASMMNRATESARQYAEQATSSVQQASRQAMEGMRQGYSQAGEMVQQHPGSSLAVALGAGLITGVMLGMLMRSR